MRILTLLFLFCVSEAFGYSEDRFASMIEASSEQWLLSSFEKHVVNFEATIPCPLEFNLEVSEITATEMTIQELIPDRSIENSCMKLLIHDNCANFMRLRAMADLYTSLFERNFASHKLPLEWAYLPAALSCYHANYSDNDERKGLWALNRMVAANHNLRIDHMIDERLTTDIATRAAIEELKDGRLNFPNNAVLPICQLLRGKAYAMEIANGKSLDAEIKYFLTFYRCFYRLNQNFKARNDLLNWMNMLSDFDVVGTKKDISIAAVSEILDIDYQLLKDANPTYVGNTIPGGYRMTPFLMPKEKTTEFYGKLNELINFVPSEKPTIIEPEFKDEEQTYVVKSGDVLGTIAENHGVTVSQIKKWNRLTSSRINVGQKLSIRSSVVPAETSPKKKKETTKQEGDYIEYRVKSGDSLYSIARKHPGISANDIMNWNKIGSDIKPGQLIKIYPQNGK